MKSYHNFLSDIFLLLVLATSLFVIFSHIALGYFTFPQVDDFHMANGVHRKHYTLFELVKDIYLTASGRFSTIATAWFAHKTIVSIYHTSFFIVPSIMLFIASLILFFCSIYKKFSDVFIIDAAYMLWIFTPGVKTQGMYYLLGNIDYLLPVSLSLLSLAAIGGIKPLRSEKLVCVGLFIWSIILAGFNEQISTGLMGILAMRIAYFRSLPNHMTKRLLATLLGLCVGFAIDIIAPGNFARHDIYTGGQPQDLLALIAITFRDLYDLALPLLLLTVCYGLIRARFCTTPSFHTAMSGRTVTLYLLSSAVIFLGMLFVVHYGYNSTKPMDGFFAVPFYYTDERVLLAPQILIIVSGLLFSNWLCSLRKIAPAKRRLLVTCLAFIPFAYIAGHYPSFFGYRMSVITQSLSLAREQQDSAFAQFRAAEAAKGSGAEIVALPPIHNYETLFLVKDIMQDATHWRNILVADYFGLKQVIPIKK